MWWGQRLSVILMARSHSMELGWGQTRGHLHQLCARKAGVHFLGTCLVLGTGGPGLMSTQPDPTRLSGQ